MKGSVYFILTIVTCWKPLDAGNGNDAAGKTVQSIQQQIKQDTLPKKIADSITASTIELKRKADSLKAVKNEQFKEKWELQEELAEKKTKVIIKEVPVPVFVDLDSSKKKEDTLVTTNDYLSPMPPPKKRKFFYRLFHNKKQKHEKYIMDIKSKRLF